ncbi:perlucin-like [Bradysia coprophila]|uniref:perlucin-like n=1 Tax=Bradysia coprophila TaxID=38358 RepID=UPI00187DC481|nr:perlucin-like [Bradysia coprophila]
MLLKAILIAACLIQTLSLAAAMDDDGFDIAATPAQMATMPRSDIINGKRFVFVSFLTANWYRAAHICKYNNMELAAVNNVEEQNAIAKLAGTVGGYSSEFYVGGNDLGLQKNWYWLATGKPISYTNWSAGEPNNFRGENERCVVILKWNKYLWNDTICDSRQLYFVCEERAITASG